MRRVLGVDGGGTSTRVAIVDEQGRVWGTGLSGPSNYDDVGVEMARQNIGLAVQQARQAAGLGDTLFDATFLGMAGVVSPQDRAVIHGIAQDLALAAPERIGVDHDCRVALAGGLSGRPGIVQIAGTGSSTFGMNAAGESWRAGGWGHLISDEGSSYWLGIQAMTAAVRSYDGRLAGTALQALVQQHLALAHMDDIMRRLYVEGLSRAEIAAMAPLVIRAAREGDGLARSLIHDGMALLADCVLAVARRLDMADGPVELAMVGGLFQAGEIVVEPFIREIHVRLPQCRVIPAELPPVLGAALLALGLANVDMNAAMVDNLRRATL